MLEYTNNKPVTFGVGVEWAYELESVLLQNLGDFSCLELIPENFFYQGDHFLEKLAETNLPVLVHGVELSLGSDEPLKSDHFQKMCDIAERTNCIGISEHLAMTESGGVEIGQLTPLNWSNELADTISRKIDSLTKKISIPFSIENVTNRFIIPDTEISEVAFINRILENTGCGFLIDLNNIDTNAYNFNYDPYEWIDGIKTENITSVHLAGGVFDDEGVLLDSHSAPVRDRVWDLYRYLLTKVIPETTIVEWTDDCPGLETLLKDTYRANEILAEALSDQSLSSPYVTKAIEKGRVSI